MDFDKTMSFKVERDSNLETKEIMKKVYQALVEKGYNPINQMVGYILSGDPTYITSHNDARNLIRKIERDELLEKMRVLRGFGWSYERIGRKLKVQPSIVRYQVIKMEKEAAENVKTT